MPRTSDDSPYREATPSRPARRRRRPAKAAKKSAAAAQPAAKPAARAHAAPKAAPKVAPASPAKRRRRRGGKGGESRPNELTSHPTSRNAMVNTRAWLLDQYGPYCAYCGTKHPPRVMTLDHVAPRRGQTAYDRRDNLVLCCAACNAAKRDMSPLAFLLAVKTRAANLVKFGSHLSDGLLAIARPLVRRGPREVWGPISDDEESPYSD